MKSYYLRLTDAFGEPFQLSHAHASLGGPQHPIALPLSEIVEFLHDAGTLPAPWQGQTHNSGYTVTEA